MAKRRRAKVSHTKFPSNAFFSRAARLLHTVSTYSLRWWRRDNHLRVQKLNDYLKARGLRTWFDSERMSGNVQEKMTSGIENSAVVVTCITKKYQDKVNGDNDGDNCKLEFLFAARVKTAKHIVPVIMEKCMLNQLKGVVAFNIGCQLYYTLLSDDALPFEQDAETIYGAIKLNIDQAPMPPSNSEASPAWPSTLVMEAAVLPAP
jgi:hypothetical protein